jgi:cyclic pyranopterin phosphate synthase
MPENGVDLRPSKAYMTPEEVVSLAKEFVDMGVTKVRLTGGEPLVYKEFSQVLKDLSALPVELSLTSNGLLLHRYFDELEAAGVKKLNISIDSLIEERFDQITRRKGFPIVWDAIQEAVQRGFEVKLNVVVMKGFNDDEIISFVDLTKKLPIQVRFIEFMPFDGNQWNWEKVVPESVLLNQITDLYGEQQVLTVPLPQNHIARNYQLKDALGQFGFISTMTHSFCGGCNRIRLTADGHLKNCLFTNQETDLLGPFRAGQNLESLIQSTIANKHKKNGGIDFEKPSSIHDHRSMISIGG